MEVEPFKKKQEIQMEISTGPPTDHLGPPTDQRLGLKLVEMEVFVALSRY